MTGAPGGTGWIAVATAGVLVPGLLLAVAPISANSGRSSGNASPVATATGKVSWHKCPGKSMAGFQCGFLRVPKDWRDPAAGTMRIAMARHRSTGPARKRIGSLFYNPGGPGGSGVGTIAQAWGFVPEAVKTRFDLVTWDPRGVGGSSGLVDCPDLEWTLPATGPVDWQAVQESTRQQAAAGNASCIAGNSDIAPYLSTMQNVRDLDAMRAAVGDKKLTFWAWSYGTRIAYSYALTFPQRFRALMLDGVTAPRGSVAQFAAGYNTAADAGLNLLFQRYRHSAHDYRTAWRYLQDHTLRLPDGRTYTRWDLGAVMESYAEWEQLYPTLAQYLDELVTIIEGHGKARAQARSFIAKVPAMPLTLMSGAAAIIQCLDYPDRPRAAEQDSLAGRARLAAPITGWLRGIQTAPACEGNTLAADPVPTTAPVNWGSTLLLLGATLDTQTPYVWAVEMGAAFRGSRTVTYVGAKHVTFGQAGSECVDEYGSDYLVNRRVPSLDVACPSVLPSIGDD